MRFETLPLETKDMLIGVVMVVFGVLFFLLPNLLQYLVGIGFILIGLLKFMPSSK
jgi:hypothetical protein